MASPIGVAILALASAVASHAGVAITTVVQELYGDNRLDTNIIRIEKEMVRIDLGGDPDTYQIYRGDLALLWTVNKEAWVTDAGNLRIRDSDARALRERA